MQIFILAQSSSRFTAYSSRLRLPVTRLHSMSLPASSRILVVLGGLAEEEPGQVQPNYSCGLSFVSSRGRLLSLGLSLLWSSHRSFPCLRPYRRGLDGGALLGLLRLVLVEPDVVSLLLLLLGLGSVGSGRICGRERIGLLLGVFVQVLSLPGHRIIL